MNVRAWAICVFMACMPVGTAQVRPRPGETPAGPPPYMQQLKSYDQEGAVTRVVLKNNLAVLVVEAHATPLVEVLMRIEYGNGDEPPDLPGAARVLEHMLLRGTTNRTAAVLASDLKALGGRLHSGAEFDHTWFRTVAPASQWKKLLEIQADALLNPLFDEGELKRQAGLIADECRDELENPRMQLQTKLLESGVAGEGVKRGLSVTKEGLSRIARDRLTALYRTAYGADRVLLVICGDILPPDVLTAVTTLYGAAKPAGGAATRTQGGIYHPGFKYSQVRGDIPVARMALGFHLPAESADDYPAIEALRVLLGTGEASILHRRLKNQKGLIYDAEARLFRSGGHGMLALQMGLAAGDLDRCQIAAFIEFELLKRQKESGGELERAVAQLSREFWEEIQTTSGRADRYARLQSRGSWKDGNDYLTRLQRVKWEDVARVAARYLTLENCALIEYLPAKSEPRNISAEAIQGTLKQLLAPAAEAERAEREKNPVEGTTIPGNSGPFKPSQVRYPFQKASILRGPELFIREDHTMPVIHVGFFFPGGKLREAGDNSGITALLMRAMFSEDTKARSADQFHRQLEAYGGILSPLIVDDYFGFQLSILSSNIEAGLDLLGEMIQSPKLFSEGIERQKVRQIAALRDGSNDRIARRHLRAALFREHSYAFDPDGSEESLSGITPDAVREWHKQNIADKKPIVVIIGDTLGTSLAGYFVQHFSGSRYEDVKLPDNFPKAIDKKSTTELSSDSFASLVAVGFQAPPDQDEDSFPLTVFQSYAGGLAGRIIAPVQERVPSARRVSVKYGAELRGGSIWICAFVARAEEELAQTVILEELQKALTSQLAYRDYRSAVNTATAGLLIDQQERFSQIAEVIKSALAGTGIEGFLEYESRLQEVKQDELQDVARRIMRSDKSVILRIHGKF